MFKIGPWVINRPTILAPMAGVTDLPFRRICRNLGAGFTVSEMITADSRLWGSRKSRYRLAHSEDNEPRSVQLAGNDPLIMAEAARANVDMGAQIIDINMGCPAKKVCKKAAGSALLKDEELVTDILEAVVNAVDIPVTLKIRTGWDTDNRNGVSIARIAEASGIRALAVHGRTRACAFKGEAEYDTIAQIADAIDIPVFANGDITSPEKAMAVLEKTGATAIMIGRGAQGNPWLFQEINHFLATGKYLQKPSLREISNTISEHVQALHNFYGEQMGTKIARKHVSWYLQYQSTLQQQQNSDVNGSNCLLNAKNELRIDDSNCSQEFRKIFNRIESAQEQYDSLALYFEKLATTEERAA
ncbi:MAG: tRNA dihydrouridine synthase DusB [Cellvibrionaceae bacterium]